MCFCVRCEEAKMNLYSTLIITLIVLQKSVVTMGQENQLSKCTLEGLQNNHPAGYPIKILLPNETDHKYSNSLIKNIEMAKMWPIFTLTSGMKIYTGYDAEALYLILFKTEDEVESIFSNIKQHTILDRKFPSPFILVSNRISHSNISGKVTELIELNNIDQAVLILPNSTQSDRFDIYGHNHYPEGNCRRTSQLVHIIGTCVGGKLESPKWFDDEMIPQKFTRCAVHVGYADIPPYIYTRNKSLSSRDNNNELHGTEKIVLDIIADHYNLTLFYKMYPALGGVSINGTANGALLDLQTRKIDIAAGGYAQDYPRWLYFDTSAQYASDSLVWSVPNIYQPFVYTKIITNSLSIVVFAGGFSIPFLILTRVSKNDSSNDYPEYRHPSTILLNMFSILMNVAVLRLPQKLKTRVMVGCLIIFSLSACFTYQADLTKMLLNRNPNAKYTNTLDIIKHNLTMYFTTNDDRYFKAEQSSTNRIILSKMIICNASHYARCLNQVVSHKNAAMCMSKSFYSYYVFTNKIHNELLFLYDEPLVTFPTNLLMPRGFFLTYRINTVIGRLFEGGIPKTISQTLAFKNRDTQKTNTLTFNNLLILFKIYFAGIVMAMIVFIGEHVVFRILCIKHRRVRIL